MAQKAKGGNTVAAVEALVEPVLAQLGLRLWDVRYEKEGPDRFLRIFIDRDEPLDIDACEEATRAINPVIDEADPIPESYYMEVGGPASGAISRRTRTLRRCAAARCWRTSSAPTRRARATCAAFSWRKKTA